MKVKTPKEDPRIKSAREAEERRADAAFIANTSELVDDATRRKIRRVGSRTRARAAIAAGAGGAGGGAGGSGGGSYDPSSGGGYATGGGSSSRTDGGLVNLV